VGPNLGGVVARIVTLRPNSFKGKVRLSDPEEIPRLLRATEQVRFKANTDLL
jgi:hypothetical protein